MIKIELIYTYLHNIDGEKLKIGYEFSDKFSITYDEKERNIIIDKKESNIPENFFGRNIDKINLVVGKNGSRKTTLLNVLGLRRDDLRNNFNFDTDSWFSIFINDSNQMVIEGNDHSLIEKFCPVLDPRRFFVIAGEFNFENKKFVQSMFSGEQEKLNILYAPTLNTNRRLSKINKTRDYRSGYQRGYMNYRGAQRRLNFLAENYEMLNRDINIIKSNIKFQIQAKNEDEEMEQNQIGENIKLYGDEIFLDILKPPIIKIPLNAKSAYELSLKEHFILLFMDRAIANAWNSKGNYSKVNKNEEAELIVKWKNKFVEKINSMTENLSISKEWSEEDFKNVFDYQKDVFKILSDEATKNIFHASENISFTQSIIDFIDVANEVSEEYFIDKETISLNIKLETPPQAIQKMCEVYDEFYFSANEHSYNNLINVVSLKIEGISDGQLSLIDLMSNIGATLDKMGKYREIEDNVLLIFDEPGQYFHPEWLRLLFKQIIQYLEVKYAKYRFSILVATHSPLLISDIPGEYITKVYSENDGTLRTQRGTSGYGDNIYNILKDSFFLNASIGEFARDKIESLFRKISQITYANEIKKENVDKINDEINLVADINIHRALEKELWKKVDKLEISLSKEYKIAMLERKIQEIKNNDSEA